ncbi:hypothetical protein SXCC_04893 [Gluconacetobacter sp. SXCC-1]|nr:hypothetical protein SXCC_04893 [Gluconacetobacter sp. SXCC-1]
MADDSDQIALSAHLHPQNAEAVLGVVERHPLHEACQRFRERRVGGASAHPACRRIGTSVSFMIRPPLPSRRRKPVFVRRASIRDYP